jgi:hypothetical protein
VLSELGSVLFGDQGNGARRLGLYRLNDDMKYTIATIIIYSPLLLLKAPPSGCSYNIYKPLAKKEARTKANFNFIRLMLV